MKQTTYEDKLVRVDLESIGEGLYGDYDPNDPNDVELLRFSVYKFDDTNWEPVDDSSYCMMIHVSTPAETQEKIVRLIHNEVCEDVLKGKSIARKCEWLSWLEV